MRVLLLLVFAGCATGYSPSEGSYPLYVTKNGDGIIGSSPEGIFCGDACGASYSEGMQVVLTASPDGFTGWTGACGGAATVCTLVMDAPKSVTATFEGSASADAGVGNSGSPDASVNNCATSPCDVFDQCGCSAGQACDLDENTGSLFCRNAGNGTESSQCSSAANCAPGYGCLDAGGVSSCRSFCSSDFDCTVPGGRCVYPIQINGQQVPVSVCSVSCSPTTSAGCPIGWGCRLKSGATFYTDCLPAGSAGDLQPCASDADCLPSFTCINDGNQTSCLHNCTLPSGGECATIAGSVCTGLTPPVIVGGTEYAVCL